MANENTEFSTELRGYKRSEVDSALNELRGELIKAAKDRQAMLEEVAGLKEQISALDASPGGALAPSFAGLGGRLESILRIAEEQSTRIIGQADIDSERIIANAKQEAAQIAESARLESIAT